MKSTPSTPGGASAAQSSLPDGPAHQAFRILQLGFVAAPILAGLDKFFNILVEWEQYLSPLFGDMIGYGRFMIIVGIVEIIAGIGVALRPRLFAYIVAAWLGGIILNLLLIPGFYDVALRDLGLLLGALALGRLSLLFDREEG